MPTYRIVTLGCKLNQADAGLVEARLRALGLTRAGDPAPGSGAAAGPAADLVVLNTCTVTSGADREARQIARRLRRDNPRAVLIATGCYAERDPESLRKDTGIDHVVGLREPAARLPAIAAAALGLPFEPEGRALGAEGATTGCDPYADPADRTRAYLKIQDGCDLRCSYCIIPAVRGGSRSVPMEQVARRIGTLVAAGFREIVFTGVNTGDWGRDLEPPRRLSDLLDRCLGVPGLGRIRLNSLEPRTITPAIVALLAAGVRLAPHLQVPLQSGCDAVLARMRRPYRTGDYAALAGALRRAVPDIGLGADVIAGFPGETEAEFRATHDFIAASPLNYLHVFSYSPRPGTPAAALPRPVPPGAIRERSAALRTLGRERSLAFRSSFVGRELEVLTLRAVRPGGRLRALTGNFIDLELELDGREPASLMNRLLRARVTRASDAATEAVLVSAADGCRSGAA
ncbi:MAG: MiaB/RimO family radical SAM methylthiotransferase [Candidatus Polarisedimenticolia bacterium]